MVFDSLAETVEGAERERFCANPRDTLMARMDRSGRETLSLRSWRHLHAAWVAGASAQTQRVVSPQCMGNEHKKRTSFAASEAYRENTQYTRCLWDRCTASPDILLGPVAFSECGRAPFNTKRLGEEPRASEEGTSAS